MDHTYNGGTTTHTGNTARSGAESAARIAGAVVLWIGALCTFFFLPFAVFASDSCFSGDSRFICSADGQQFAAVMPMVVAPLTCAFGTWGIVSRRPRLLVLYAVAMAVLVAAWGVNLSIAQ